MNKANIATILVTVLILTVVWWTIRICMLRGAVSVAICCIVKECCYNILKPETCALCNRFTARMLSLGAQESIPPGWESIPGLLKRFANTGSVQLSINVDIPVCFQSFCCLQHLLGIFSILSYRCSAYA